MKQQAKSRDLIEESVEQTRTEGMAVYQAVAQFYAPEEATMIAVAKILSDLDTVRMLDGVQWQRLQLAVSLRGNAELQQALTKAEDARAPKPPVDNTHQRSVVLDRCKDHIGPVRVLRPRSS